MATPITKPQQYKDGQYSFVAALTPYDATRIGDDVQSEDVSGGISSAFFGHTVRVAALEDTTIAIGTAPTSTVGAFMPEGLVEYFKIIPGDKIAVSGSANITLMQ